MLLPLGAIRIGKDGHTKFSHDEQFTVMTLWSICRSPLVFGGNLPDTDDFTLSLLTNDEVLAVDQHSTGGHQLFRREELIAWVADVPDSPDKYLAVFNVQDAEKSSDPAGLPVPVKLTDLGFTGLCKIRDLWTHRDLAPASGDFSPIVPFHGAKLFRVSENGTTDEYR